jgi:hypothetical protein
MAVQQPKQQPASCHDSLSPAFSPPAAAHAQQQQQQQQQQGASALALVNQQLAAQVLWMCPSGPSRADRFSLHHCVHHLVAFGAQLPPTPLQGSRLHLDGRGALWLLPTTAATPGAAHGSAAPPTEQAAPPLQRQDPAAAAPVQQATAAPGDTQRIASAAARAAAAAAAAFGQGSAPQSIGAAAAIIESGNLPAQVPPPLCRSACVT